LELIEKLQNAKWFKAATKAGTHKKLFSKLHTLACLNAHVRRAQLKRCIPGVLGLVKIQFNAGNNSHHLRARTLAEELGEELSAAVQMLNLGMQVKQMDVATQAREDAEAEQQDLRALVAQRDEIVSLAVEAESGSYDAEVGARRLMSTKSSLERVLDKNASAIDGNDAAPAPSLLSTVTSKLNSLMTPTPTTAAAAAQSAAASRASPKAHDLAALMATDRLSHLHVAYDELQFDELLSKGAFADVHVGRFHEERVAIKMLNRPMVTADVGLFHREVQIMSRLRSDRLVQLCAVCIEQGRVCLVVQHMLHGSLFQVLIASVHSRVVICFFVLLANSRTPLTCCVFL
jgi:hypothetical protein